MRATAADVGVVVCVRNGAATLAATLRSVLGQQPPPGDVLVVDGASTDDSVRIASGFDDVRMLHQRSTGLGAARNESVAEVRGAVIAWCDADDEWPDGSLATRLRHLTPVGPSAVVGSLVATELAESDVPHRLDHRLGQAVPGYTPGALLATRDAYAAVGAFDEDLRIGSDSDWFVRLVQSDVALTVIADVVLHKGARGGSLSADIETYRREMLVVARAFIRRRRTAPNP